MANSLTPLSYHLGQANFALARFGTYYEELCEISNQLESKKKGWIRIATDLGKKTLDAEEIKQGLPEDVRYCYQIEKTRDFALGIFTELNKVLALCQQVSSEYTNALRTLDSPPEIIKSKFTYIPNIKEPRKNEINSLLDELNEKNSVGNNVLKSGRLVSMLVLICARSSSFLSITESKVSGFSAMKYCLDFLLK